MRVVEKDREKTAFNIREGKFQWRVMPFSLCNAPTSFQSLMNRIMRPLLSKSVVIYLNDIAIYSNNLNEYA
jgi:Reverse transcriptase (RNA-dependent DNA polymerase)